jgi:hypothetical protein
LSNTGFICNHVFEGKGPITLAVELQRICGKKAHGKRFTGGMSRDYVTNVVMKSQTTESKPVIEIILQVKLRGLFVAKS